MIQLLIFYGMTGNSKRSWNSCQNANTVVNLFNKTPLCALMVIGIVMTVLIISGGVWVMTDGR